MERDWQKSGVVLFRDEDGLWKHGEVVDRMERGGVQIRRSDLRGISREFDSILRCSTGECIELETTEWWKEVREARAAGPGGRSQRVADLAQRCRSRLERVCVLLREAAEAAGAPEILARWALERNSLAGTGGDTEEGALLMGGWLQAFLLGRSPRLWQGTGNPAEVSWEPVRLALREGYRTMANLRVLEASGDGAGAMMRMEWRERLRLKGEEGYPRQRMEWIASRFEPAEEAVEGVLGIGTRTLAGMAWKLGKAARRGSAPLGTDGRRRGMEDSSVAVDSAPTGRAAFFTFTEEDCLQSCPSAVDPEALKRLLAWISHAPGQLAGRDALSLYRDDPVRKRPLVRLGEGRYFWPWAGLSDGGWEWIEAGLCGLLVQDGREEIARQLAAAREEFVPRRLERLFLRAFPAALVEREDGGKLTVTVDRYRFQLHALREWVTELPPSKGSEDEAADGGTPAGSAAAVDDSETVSLRITAASPALLGEGLARLGEAGAAPREKRSCPILSLADLENAFTLLDGAARKADYLAKRASLAGSGDEMSRVRAYIRTRSPAPGGREGKGPDAATVFLPYLERHWEGRKVPRIQESTTHWWGSMIRKLEKEQGEDWLRISTRLLQVDLYNQHRFERELKDLRKRLRQEGGRQGTQPVIVDEEHGLMGLVFREEEPVPPFSPFRIGVKVWRKRWKEGGGFVVIALHAEKPRYPYTTIGMLEHRLS